MCTLPIHSLSVRILFLFLLVLQPSLATAEHNVFSKSVLVIHSYHKDMQWVEEVHQGFKETLITSLGDSVDIKVEYMDSKRYVNDDYFQALVNTWQHKYKTNKPDCLIVCDDNALNLILSLRDTLFEGVPIVFCGINHYDPKRFSEIKDITGVVEAYDLPGTIELIKQLLPEHRNLLVINDHTTTGWANKERLEAIQYQFANHFSFIYSGKQTLEQLRSTTRSLTKNTAILLMSFNRDADGKMLRYRDAIHAVRESSPNPIFGVWSFYLGRGIVGGSLVSGFTQGQKAAELCLAILEGTSATELPIITESPNKPMFDYNELQRFAISRSLLPSDSTVINMPDSLWHRYKWVILGSCGILIIQFFIITLLVHNVRQRRRSELRLQKNQQNLSITLEAIGEGVISVDNSFQILRVNPSASSILEVTTENLVGISLTHILKKLDPEGGEKIAEVIRGCCSTGQTIELPEETTLKLARRPEKNLSGTCSPIRDTLGRVIGAVLICRDITEKKTMQTMLSQSRKMEAIGQLAGGVAHDFNNLLTGISGYAELLTMQLREDQKKSETASKIIHAAGRAKDLTRQLLSFARKGKIISSPVDCHRSLTSAIGLLERTIDKSITIKSLLHAEYSVIVGDPVQLENIFLNLGINSADSMPEGGTLTFQTENEQISSATACEFGEILEAGDYLRVSVSDTGCGIDEESRQAIFEPFFTTKGEGKGTGLGLSAVFGAMKEHEGRIRLFTASGAGTEFHLYFPIEKFTRTTDTLYSSPAERGSETILVIDDERLILSTAKALLSELGYNVLLAEGPAEGLALYKKKSSEIDLVLLDMIMPEMDGVSCFKALKNINKNVGVIICSGFAKTSRVGKVEELGALGFLQKPYSAAEVSRTIRKALQK